MNGSDKMITRKELHDLTRKLMDQHGLTNWTVRIGSAKRQAGSCNYSKRTIAISLDVAQRVSEEQYTDTILHEIAHALAGSSAGHGPAWKAVCVRIGASPEATYQTSQLLEKPTYRFDYMCPNHPDVTGSVHRRRSYVCSRCKTSLVYFDHQNPELGYQPYTSETTRNRLETYALSLGASIRGGVITAPTGYVWSATDTHDLDTSLATYTENPARLADDLREGLVPCSLLTDCYC